MKSQRIIQITEKLLNKLFILFGLDRLSGIRIKRRNDLKEIGTKYGGWVIPTTLINSESICYCIGCGEDISFDLGLIKKFGCDVYAFDPTPRAIKYVNKVTSLESQYHFFELGLWDKKDILKFYVPRNSEHVSHSLLNLQKTEKHISVRVDRLKNIMKEIGHSRIDILKIDIEGAEYKVIESIMEDEIDIKIICVEYDENFNPIDYKYKERIRSSIQGLLTNGYILVSAPGNGNYTLVKEN